MSSWSAHNFNKEAATLAAIVENTDGDFTLAEAEHWAKRLTAAHAVDYQTWRNA